MRYWRREEVQKSQGPRVPRSRGPKVPGSQKDQDISNSHSNTSLTLKKVHLVSVLLEVSLETEESEHVLLYPVKMVDNGEGMLDITGDDGVYSRFVPKYPGDGRYVTRIRVETTSQSSLLSRAKIPCCGSCTHPTPENLSSTTSFSMTVAGPTLHLDKTVTIPKPPISRIMDLSLTHNSTGVITLTWTGHQKVNYRIFFSSDIEDLMVSTSQHFCRCWQI